MWVRRNEGLGGLYVTALALFESDGTQHLLAGTWGDGVFVSNDGGTRWQAAVTQPASPHIHDLASVLGYGGRVVSFAATASGLYRSLDLGQQWMATGFQGKDVRSVALHPSYATRPNCYVGVLGEGVLVSSNGGLTWRALSEGQESDCFDDLLVATRDVSPTLYGASGAGICRYGSAQAPSCFLVRLPLAFGKATLLPQVAVPSSPPAPEENAGSQVEPPAPDRRAEGERPVGPQRR